ncbi:MAG TPA: hypothetical protein VGS19_01200 [Streptosporangiaceae bacterium]|nr:hypothetical protein [Streptosporangiaceae bacterium]
MPSYRMVAPRVAELAATLTDRTAVEETPLRLGVASWIETLVEAGFEDAGVLPAAGAPLGLWRAAMTVSGNAVYFTLGDGKVGPGGLAELDSHRGNATRIEALEGIFRGVIRELYWRAADYSDDDRPFPDAPIEADVHVEEV